MSKELGNFQTPPALVADVLQCLGVDGHLWSRVLEPTCGYGNFISGLLALAVPPKPESTLSFVKSKLVANIKAYEHSAFVDGNSSLTWWQGVKHDAASVMELTCKSQGIFQNKLEEPVNIEPDYIYPLLKCSDLFHGRTNSQRAVIITQKRVGESTYHLQEIAPRLWNYLNTHANYFSKRKSSIYQGKPPFSMFGIGDYSFTLYKVGISGLHKKPRFRVIAPVGKRPVMLDDTCYFVPCYSLEQATFLASLLNSPSCLDFINSRIFLDAKRPITKKLLQCINLKALFERLELEQLLLQASAEFERLQTDSNKRKPLWPSSLEELLIERSR